MKNVQKHTAPRWYRTTVYAVSAMSVVIWAVVSLALVSR